jgi:septation ring formation regulator EzrA
MSPADAMNVASRERTSQYARKYTVLHKISEWEVHLDTAKGKVHECEETLQKLREEVEVVDVNLGRLESGMEGFKRAMQRPRHPRNIAEIRDCKSNHESSARV